MLAEYSGMSKIRAAIEGLRIEEMITRTGKPKEAAPPIATPHVGGTLRYRAELLRACRPLLEKKRSGTGGYGSRRCRLSAFSLRQIERIKSAPGFPVDYRRGANSMVVK